jgi:hypothetical protein
MIVLDSEPVIKKRRLTDSSTGDNLSICDLVRRPGGLLPSRPSAVITMEVSPTSEICSREGSGGYRSARRRLGCLANGILTTVGLWAGL